MKTMDIVIWQSGPETAEAFIALTELVRQGMDHQEWFYLDPPELVRQMADRGQLRFWTAMDGDTLAAVFSTITPGLEECNYGYDLGFSREQLLQVVNMDTAAVHPDYRGLGLQRALMTRAEADLAAEGKFVLLCTIHPDNGYSLNNALKMGYVMQKRLEKYGSVRYILRKDLL